MSVMVCAAAGITPTLAWTLLNAGIALFGYYGTTWLIDDISWGRYHIQVPGLLKPRVCCTRHIRCCQICRAAACSTLNTLLSGDQNLRATPQPSMLS